MKEMNPMLATPAAIVRKAMGVEGSPSAMRCVVHVEYRFFV